jgi:hypothetical protein
LQALRDGETVSAAVELAGYSRRSVYEWREADAEFREAWEDAYEQGTEALENIAAQRARDKSDTLLIFLLKSRKPERFADKHQLEHTGEGGGPLQVTIRRFGDGSESQES